MKNIVAMAIILLYCTNVYGAKEVSLSQFMDWKLDFTTSFNHQLKKDVRKNPDPNAAIKNVSLFYMLNISASPPNLICVQISFEENGRWRQFTRRQHDVFIEDEPLDSPSGPKPFPYEKSFSDKNIDRGPE